MFSQRCGDGATRSQGYPEPKALWASMIGAEILARLRFQLLTQFGILDIKKMCTVPSETSDTITTK